MKKWGHLSGFHVSFLSYGPWIVQKSAFFSDDHRKKFRSVKAIYRYASGRAHYTHCCDHGRSSVYLRLISRNVCSIEGKRHVNTTPEKVLRSQNSKHNSHEGATFARSTFWHLEAIAEFLGPEEVIFHSQNSKVKVPSGVDENSRHEKPISCAVEYFSTYDLDAFFLVTNAPLVHSIELTEEWLPFAKSWVVFYLSTNILERIWMTKETHLIFNLNWKTLNKLERF